jgi:hypothetical protein
MKKQNAFEKFCESYAREKSAFWNSVIMGQCSLSVSFDEMGCAVSSFKEYARKSGFKTKTWSSDSILIYR